MVTTEWQLLLAQQITASLFSMLKSKYPQVGAGVSNVFHGVFHGAFCSLIHGAFQPKLVVGYVSGHSEIQGVVLEVLCVTHRVVQ